MTEPDPYDSSTFDLGGLPGGDALFTDPTSTSYAEPAPTAPVQPAGGTVYRPHPPPAATSSPTPPTPPARWPRPEDPVRGRPVRPALPPRSHGRRRGRKGAWPLVAVLIWGGPVAIHAITGGSDSRPSSSSPSEALPADESPVHVGDMTILKPHSLSQDSAGLVIHVDAPASGQYTITDNGSPLKSGVTAAYDQDLAGTTVADTLVVAASDDAATVRCEIRDAQGEVVATGEAAGTLECDYDPDILLE